MAVRWSGGAAVRFDAQIGLARPGRPASPATPASFRRTPRWRTPPARDPGRSRRWWASSAAPGGRRRPSHAGRRPAACPVRRTRRGVDRDGAGVGQAARSAAPTAVLRAAVNRSASKPAGFDGRRRTGPNRARTRWDGRSPRRGPASSTRQAPCLRCAGPQPDAHALEVLQRRQAQRLLKAVLQGAPRQAEFAAQRRHVERRLRGARPSRSAPGPAPGRRSGGRPARWRGGGVASKRSSASASPSSRGARVGPARPEPGAGSSSDRIASTSSSRIQAGRRLIGRCAAVRRPPGPRWIEPCQGGGPMLTTSSSKSRGCAG